MSLRGWCFARVSRQARCAYAGGSAGLKTATAIATGRGGRPARPRRRP
jgi:hypothetical protein